VLGRQDGRFQRAASFFDTISQDPALSRVKLIAEPWDLGAYEVGNFPVDWSEWNGRFRDNGRKFQRGDAGQVKELGYRLTGSSDLYADDGRSAYNTINFITCHDGFTLWDLVSYDRKHNESNGEDNRDGTDDNASWNSGAEGETDDPAINRLRRQRARSFMIELLCSAGTPMLLGGDEMLRTQRGNNNAYCHDDEMSWFDWRMLDEPERRSFFELTKRAIAFTKLYPVFARRSFFSGRDSNLDSRLDIQWFGKNLDAPSWDDPELRTLAYQLDGAEAERGAGDYLVFVILNADWREQTVRVPDPGGARKWRRVADTSLDAGQDFLAEDEYVLLAPPDRYVVQPRSTVVLLAR
jgi:isoamylase